MEMLETLTQAVAFEDDVRWTPLPAPAEEDTVTALADPLAFLDAMASRTWSHARQNGSA